MKLSTALDYAGDPRAAADSVRALEQAGLDTVWVAEAYGFDAPSLMGYLAARTETVEIGSAIMNIYSRTATALGQTAAGLDNVSGGRTILGLGASGPQVIEGWHGVAYEKPVARMREVVDIIRRVLRREVIENDGLIKLPLPQGEGTGLAKPLKLLNRPGRPAVPIYVAALGPRSVEGTAEYADGWIPTMFVPERAGTVWGESLAAGTARRTEGLAPLEVVAGGLVAIGDDVKGCLDLARPMFALYIGGMGARDKNFYNDLVSQLGWAEEAREIQDLYLAGHKKEAEARVPLDLLEATNLVGPRDYVLDRIAAYREAGVTNLMIKPAGDDPVTTVREMRDLVDR
ncbi:LLM class F420-dependent oxidoreductase [Nocardioides houyundeii]|uniref:LLM class F420-dependent oxidoreductase n=1 Tax=Nocardioides houyundeii TaxID=2045452 RepID=UPI000DF1E1F4|nr:LLM class F420-dependent oxidoreductase [Nocardioides houyundeii]